MVSEARKLQLREAQRRRREKLAAGERSQVNIFLSEESKLLMDKWCEEYDIDRHQFINALIKAHSESPDSTSLVFNK